MSLDHRYLASSNVHEPKHISDSTSSDIGKVITPLGDGTSELRALTPEEVGVKVIYGEAALDANNVSFPITAATDATLYTLTDYVQVNSTRIPTVYLDQNSGVTFDSIANSMQPSLNGVYKIHVWMNIKSDTANSKIGIKAKKNGTWCNFTAKTDIKDAGRTQNITSYIITDLTTTSDVTIWLACDKTANLTIQDMRFSVELLKEI